MNAHNVCEHAGFRVAVIGQRPPDFVLFMTH